MSTKRKFLKLLSTSLLGFFYYPVSSLANNLIGFSIKLKKDESEYNIINPDLTDEQKKLCSKRQQNVLEQVN